MLSEVSLLTTVKEFSYHIKVVQYLPRIATIILAMLVRLVIMSLIEETVLLTGLFMFFARVHFLQSSNMIVVNDVFCLKQTERKLECKLVDQGNRNQMYHGKCCISPYYPFCLLLWIKSIFSLSLLLRVV